MHWIQRHILKNLTFNDSLKYSQLKPDTVDGNLFQYHARQLESGGLILRTADGYTLTEAGKSLVAELSQTKLMQRRRLARVVVMIACRNTAGQYLLFKWHRQPYRDLVSLPFGRQLAGQSSLETASEQLRLKAGYAAEFEYVGLADIISGRNPESIHLSCQLFRGTSLVESDQPDGLTGQFFWGDPSDFAPDTTVAGFHELIAWLEDPNSSPLLQILPS